MNSVSPPSEPPRFDPVVALRRVRDQAAFTVAACDQAILAAQAAAAETPFRLPDESEDHLDYRRGRRLKGQLSDLGNRVGEAFLLAGFTDEAVGGFMSVTPWGIGQLRRRLGLRYGHRQHR